MKPYILIIYILFTLLHTSCNSTRFINTWREPVIKNHTRALNKVLVVALFENETSRRIAEDQMIIYLNGKGAVSYNYFDEYTSVENEQLIRNKIISDGFDGAIIMRLLDVEKEEIYIRDKLSNHSGHNHNFCRHYLKNWDEYCNPGYYLITKSYIVETNIFSIKEDKIIWIGITKTIELGGVSQMTKEIGKAVYKKMIKEGFIID